MYCAKRLKTPLTKANFTKMKSIGAGYKGKHYDTLFQWSDNKMYCSELIWKRYGNSFNPDEPVVSPYALFKSELLETVSYAEY